MGHKLGFAVALLLLVSPAAGHAGKRPTATAFQVVNLVSNQAGQAKYVDTNLINPWGLAQGPGNDPVWAADTGTGVASVYKQKTGKIGNEVVTIPDGNPTGVVYVPSGTGFGISENGNSGDAIFLFDSYAGVISGWNRSVDAKNAVIAYTSPNSSFYTGLAIDPSSQLLFAADLANNAVDVLDNTFTLTNTFTDTSLPKGFSVFNVAVINGDVYVTFTKNFFFGKKGNGYVDIFSESGTLLQQLIAKGPLNSPWGITIAPASFGTFANSLLVGNLVDGKINAFDPDTGKFLGTLSDKKGKPIVISGLWALDPVPKGAVTFSAGPDYYNDGLLGLIEPAK